jgi:hypothetical protein
VRSVTNDDEQGRGTETGRGVENRVSALSQRARRPTILDDINQFERGGTSCTGGGSAAGVPSVTEGKSGAIDTRGLWQRHAQVGAEFLET